MFVCKCVACLQEDEADSPGMLSCQCSPGRDWFVSTCEVALFGVFSFIPVLTAQRVRSLSLCPPISLLSSSDQCVGSLPATPDLAEEMNRVESAVDFIAGQEHTDSEKTEILDIAAKAISSAGNF